MPTITSLSGTATEYSIEVRHANGKLFYHEASVMFPELPPMPKQPECYTVECINAYKKRIDLWAGECKELANFYKLLHEYHAARCAYCMKHKHDNIEEKYILGEPAPRTIEEAKEEIRKLRGKVVILEAEEILRQAIKISTDTN